MKKNWFGLITFPFSSIFFNIRTISISIKDIFLSIVKHEDLRMFDEHNALNTYWYDTLTYNLIKHSSLVFLIQLPTKDILLGIGFISVFFLCILSGNQVS